MTWLIRCMITIVVMNFNIVVNVLCTELGVGGIANNILLLHS